MEIETGTEVIIILNSRSSCPLDFLNRLKQEMLFIAPGVPEGVLLTVRQLSSKEYYAALSVGDQKLTGPVMDYLVEHGLVPFENVPRTGRNPYPLQYRIKASYTPNR